jgi:hypothetical protein
MKIKSYKKKQGVFDISCDIHLLFSGKNSLNGKFIIRDLSVDAKACFDKNLSHTDLNELAKLIDQSVESFIKKNEYEKAEHKKLIYVNYTSSSAMFQDEKSKSVDIDLSFEVLDTYWNDALLLKAVRMDGKEVTVERNCPINFNTGDCQHIPYTPEAEHFLQELVNRISEVQNKLNEFFSNDYFSKDKTPLDQKIKTLMSSDQKLLG